MKRLLLLIICVMAMVKAFAVPAYPYPVEHVQPDGSTITIVAHGDEFFNFTTTIDGYTIMKNEQGFFVYASLQDGALVATRQLAHNVSERTADEKAFLATIEKNIHSEAAARNAKKVRQNVATKQSAEFYKNFKGLVILVEFNDKKFLRSDAQSFYNHMFNDVNYAGYKNENGTSNNYGNLFIGGVRDYFSNNSNGMFSPQFDVVGPVTVDMSCKDVNKTENALNLLYQAILKVGSNGFDLSKYDIDGDGFVDMMYFIVAGYGSNYSGNDSGYLWPHKYTFAMGDIMYNGAKLGTYACSVEIYGQESQGSTVPDGIGTICHEFSHAIGLRDLYDTDYETNGQSNHPGKWDIMAGGSYNTYGRRPVGYSAYERYATGFTTPKYITQPGKYTLNELQSSGDMLILPSANKDEYFIFENRQQSSWDETLPGHGMLVARLDSSDASVWTSNKVNANASRNYYELVRAGGATSSASGSDTYPGTMNVTELNNFTTPALLTWDGKFSNLIISGIDETGGTITFNVRKPDAFKEKFEDFETMGTTSTDGATGVKGRFCNWDFTKCNVESISDKNKGNGSFAVAMKKPSTITTSEISFKPVLASAVLSNPSTAEAKFKLQYLPKGSTTWTDANPTEVSVAAGGKLTATFTLPGLSSAKYRIYQLGGSTTAKVYVDDIRFSYTPLHGDLNGDGDLNAADVNTLVGHILSGAATPEGVEAVDLGLPSGTLWANMNIGATEPTERGTFFAWGETEPKAEYTWDNYLCSQAECGTDADPLKDLTSISGTAYDAARAKWGGSWRMPTKAEVEELLTECTWTRAINTRITGSNGNNIVIPASQIISLKQNLYSHYYWISDKSTTSSEKAARMTISERVKTAMGDRYLGSPIRPVSSVPVDPNFGDMNGDGTVNAADVNTLVGIILNGGN